MNEFINELKNINSIDKAFLLFRHILLGFSFDYKNNFYVKHNSLLESTYVSEFNQITELESKKKGLITESEKLKILEKNGSWTKQEENKYQDRLKRILDLKQSKKKLVIPSQIAQAEEILNKEIQDFTVYFLERNEILGLTVEGFLTSKNYQYYIENFFFKNSKLDEKIHSEEEFEDLDPEYSRKYYDYYNDFQEIFSERNLKKISCAPPVYNTLYLSKTPSDFFGKSISELTMNQISIYSNYLYYKNVSSSPDFRDPPQECYANLDRLVDYYDQQYSIISTKNKTKKQDKGRN